MTDQCKHCDLRGNYEKCIKADCFHHENWIAEVRIARIKYLEETLEAIIDLATDDMNVQSYMAKEALKNNNG